MYFVFFDSLCLVEPSLKSKVPRQAKEELDSIVFVLEKILIFLPDLIRRRWQFQSLKVIMLKLLHPGNIVRVRQDGMRCFLLWYQILGVPIEPEVRAIYESLINFGGRELSMDPYVTEAPCTMIQPVEIEPLIPSIPSDPIPKGLPVLMLNSLLDLMVSTVTSIQWRVDVRETVYLTCFRFLWDEFCTIYVNQIFPEMPRESLYSGKFDLPMPRRLIDENETKTSAKAVVISWLAKYLSSIQPGSVEGTAYQMECLKYEIVRHALNSSRETIDLMNEIFRQAFLLPFSEQVTIGKVIGVYKEWLSGGSNERLPLFLQEPSNENCIQVGSSRIMRAFVVHSSYVFFVQIPPDRPLMLEPQIDMCKRVLNIYRYMVMKVDMDKETWEQLLLVLLQVTCFVIPSRIPEPRESTLGGRMAPAFFQTLIVTWIRANLYIHVPVELWERFQSILSTLTHWEELLHEWAKTMETITRVMSRYVYNINLLDLPLDKLTTDRRDRRRRAVTEAPLRSHIDTNQPTTDSPASTPAYNQSPIKKLPANRRLSGRVKNANRLRRSTSDSQLNVLGKTKRRNSRRSLELFSRSSPEVSDDSRSPSPSSGRDSTSLKESPINLDGVSLHSNVSNVSNVHNQMNRCVIVGGTCKGWSTDSAVILWRRFIGVLGDPNAITSPTTHALAMEALNKMVDDLSKINDNLSIGDTSPSSPPQLVPPIAFFSPWLLRCMQLNGAYKRGKLIALKSLCQICLRRHETTPLYPDASLLCHFYAILMQSLSSPDLETCMVTMISCSTKPLIYGLPGATILLNSLLDAASRIIHPQKLDSSQINSISSELLRQARLEAINLLGTIIGLSPFLEQVERLNQSIDINNRIDNCKDRSLTLLFRATRARSTLDSSVNERALVLVSIGLLVHQELTLRVKNNRIVDAIDSLIAETQNVDRLILRVSCEMLTLQIEHAVYLLDDYADLPKKIIEGLARSLIVAINRSMDDSNTLSSSSSNRYASDSLECVREIVLTLIMCLGEWCMAVSFDYLKKSGLLAVVIKNLHGVINESHLLQTESTSSNINTQDANSIVLAARMLLGFLLNHLGHFPRSQLGAANVNCDVEADEKLTHDPLYFVLEDYSIVSFTCLSENRIRVILRDLTGKFAWDCQQINEKLSHDNIDDDNHRQQQQQRAPLVERTSDEFDEADHEQETDRIDLLSSLLSCVGQNSPDMGRTRRASSSLLSAQAEENLIALLLNQHYQEMNYLEQRSEGRNASLSSSHASLHVTSTLNSFNTTTTTTTASSSCNISGDVNLISSDKKCNIDAATSVDCLPWPQCRRLIDQLGFLSWERRGKVALLNSTDRVKRELRNLDNQRCRETHKIAVIYVAEGQEDKNCILLNKCGSKAFETFVSALGWEVDLTTHTGFRGGLQSNGSTGLTAPYYCTPLLEVIFHVSTRIPASCDQLDSLTRKLRHLGNDEIHIIWSEHWRDYRRGIIPTAFGDVLIIIYPVNGITDMYRIQIIRKKEVQFFGPLFNGAVVHSSLLPCLVRATAINASRVQRLNVPLYETFFEERANCLQSAIKNAEDTSFEDFASTVYTSPAKWPFSNTLANLTAES